MSYLRELYNTTICEKLSIVYEDLTDTEKQIMEESYNILHDRIKDNKELEDQIYRLTIEIKNLKAYNDNKDYE